MIIDTTKGFWRSKTFWINAAGLAAAASGMIPPEYQKAFVVVQGLINIGLRFATDSPISLTGE